MFFILILLFSLLNIQFSYSTNETTIDNIVPHVTDIADAFLTLLGQDGNKESKRIDELKEKLAKIDSYDVDREKYTNRLSNEAKLYDLKSTNFYLALKEQDYFKFLNDTRNLYVKLKERINRDDLLKILAERGQKKIKKSARRMMKEDYLPDYKDKVLDDAVDKFLGEYVNDDHKFNKKDSWSKYWDPLPELEERKEFYQPVGGRRIFKGERTHITRYPFMVSIQLIGRFWCGGFIWWQDIVITSAACLQLLHNNRFYRENPKVLAVRVGSNHSRSGGEVLEAEEVYFHPSYNPKTLEHNIAIIRLTRFIRFNYHRVPKMIDISHSDGGVPLTAEVLLLGWGVSKTSQKLAFAPLFLQRKVLPVYPNKFCKEVYGERFNMRTMFCAGTMTTGEGACSHDAGGPAILSGRAVGIISYGPTVCGYPGTPTVLTLLGAYADWIETVNETMPEYYRGVRKRTTTTTEHPYVLYYKTPRGKRLEDIATTAPQEEEEEPEEPKLERMRKRDKKLKMNADRMDTLEFDVEVKEDSESVSSQNFNKIIPGILPDHDEEQSVEMIGHIDTNSVEITTKNKIPIHFKPGIHIMTNYKNKNKKKLSANAESPIAFFPPDFFRASNDKSNSENNKIVDEPNNAKKVNTSSDKNSASTTKNHKYVVQAKDKKGTEDSKITSKIVTRNKENRKIKVKRT